MGDSEKGEHRRENEPLGIGPKLKRSKKGFNVQKERMCSRHLNYYFVPVELKMNSRWKQRSKLHWWGWGPRLLNWTILHSPEKARVSREDCQDVSVSRSLMTESCLFVCALLRDGQLWSRCVLPKHRIFLFVCFCTGFVESWLKSNNLLVSHYSRKWVARQLPEADHFFTMLPLPYFIELQDIVEFQISSVPQ